ncbi:MAG: metal ABC transporter ATP-binding protein [Jaaginema sp. PMC 1079.18]|nr:metal ABC transporter ATP-binding protein [Jaaginema sp. PMC 1080.18]MEC4850899.1 metal ABC transporter ATP-binding protein [Jaaginema sp. PMC 1079.18]MEC4865020.1 metal ABC transporter ATP-binding protein [Jaaginema sp. PMC 1078.18]
MLEVRNLGVCYRNNWAVRNLSFCLQPGQLTCLLGPNGAGKSTAIKAILGLVPKIQGECFWNERPLKSQLQRIAYVPQRVQIDWDYPVTVQNVVMMGRTRQTGWFRTPSRYALEVVKNALERVEMLQYAKTPIGQLSGGQQQRVFMARALAQEADLFFFDEPFVGIDKKTEDLIFAVFAELKAHQKTLLVISHDLSETLGHYDRFLLLNQSLVAAGRDREVLTSANLQKAYGKKLNLLVA